MLSLLWQQIANTTVSRILCSTNMDGIVLDCEHGYFNPETLVNCIEIIKLARKKCFVRTKYNETIVQLAYDNKCNGVIMSTVEYKAKFVNFGIGLVRHNFWGRFKLDREVEFLKIAQIETIPGFQKVKSRYINDYDYYMLTPYDFRNAIKHSNATNHTKKSYIEYEKEFNAIMPKEKRAAHIVKNIGTDYEKYKDYGLKCFSLDTLMILDAVKGLDKYA